MSGEPLGCTVYLDGARFADGRPGDDPLAPTALSGLSVTWGRTTTMEQPEPSSCVFEVMDQRGSTSFLSTLYVGQRVDVEAEATTYPAPTVPAVDDPTWASTAPGTVPRSFAVTSTTRVSAIAGGGVWVTPRTSGAAASVTIAPADFDPVHPTAWDHLPVATESQSWDLDVRLMVPSFVDATVQAVLFTGPDDRAGTVFGPVQSVAGTIDPAELAEGAVVDVAWSAVPPGRGFVGVRVRTSGAAAWDEIPADVTWDDVDDEITWDGIGRVRLERLDVMAPAAGTVRYGSVFAGHVTDLVAAWDVDEGYTRVKVTCSDLTSDLENRNVGEVPWAVEAMGTRFDRVLALAGTDLDSRIDAALAPTLLSYQDVDSQGALNLLQDYAQSVDGVLWSAVHLTTGPYLWVEDVAARSSGATLEEQDGVVVIVPATAGKRLEISACDLLLEPVEWAQDTADVATRVEVSWKEQGVDDKGKPTTTDRTVTIVDPVAEAEGGTRRASVSTLLTSSDDATDVAGRIKARSSRGDWRASGLVWEIGADALDVADVDRAFTLLDGTTRIGAPLTLSDLPSWSPVPDDEIPVYLEGGTYEYVEGSWRLELLVSRAVGLGGSVVWDALDPTWSWDQFDPEISWEDLWGVTTT